MCRVESRLSLILCYLIQIWSAVRDEISLLNPFDIILRQWHHSPLHFRLDFPWWHWLSWLRLLMLGHRHRLFHCCLLLRVLSVILFLSLINLFVCLLDHLILEHWVIIIICIFCLFIHYVHSRCFCCCLRRLQGIVIINAFFFFFW